jgi:hypothetical protein
VLKKEVREQFRKLCSKQKVSPRYKNYSEWKYEFLGLPENLTSPEPNKMNINDLRKVLKLLLEKQIFLSEKI